MTDDTGSPKNVDTLRPEAGDGEDVYSASTKVGIASSELLALIRGEDSASLRAPAVPADAIGPEAAPPDTAAPDAERSGAERTQGEGAEEPSVPPGPPAPDASAAGAEPEPERQEIERKLEHVGRPSVGAGSVLALLVLALLALWFGWQATQSAPDPPAPAPATSTP